LEGNLPPKLLIASSKLLALGVLLTDEILRNGVPHKVTTSLVTHNAVLPQNTFIQEKAPDLGEAGALDVPLAKAARNASDAFQKSASKPPSEPSPTYPVSQEKLQSNDSLTAIKSHIRDNVQALKNLAHSDNFQSLGTSRAIQDNTLFLEKKSIKSNRQKITQTTTERATAHLNSPAEFNPNALTSEKLASQTQEVQAADSSNNNEKISNGDSAFQIRVKKLKKHVLNVDSTLQNLDQDK
jgi:hypothetical protein